MIEKFLEKNKSVTSVSKEGSINVGLSVKHRLMANDNLSKTFSLYGQYNLERDTCNKFRVICEINPICSNILFNRKTEIVYKEGSDDCYAILEGGGSKNLKSQFSTIQNTEDVDYMQAMRDTEYSHKNNGGLVYHCGLNIFNNHMLRAVNFTHVNKMNDDSRGDSEKVFNTIRDYVRDGQGNLVKEKLHYSISHGHSQEPTNVHLYERDTILSFKNTYKQKLIEKDGWWGFTNPGNMEIPNSDNDTTINRMMANNKPCEFIDMYPDRSLFSFIPKYNKYRNRIEKNWDYCITYPYKSDYDYINKLCGGKEQAIRCYCSITHNASGVELLQCRSMFKHNLSVGGFINVYNYNTKGEFTKYSQKVVVMGVGDSNGEDTDYIFTVRLSDVKRIYNNDGELYFKKIVNSTESNYYLRIFKKIKGFDSNGERTLELKSDVNKIAYAKNIYGDDMAQILFTDDIDVSGLLDNNGRPVTKVYLTIVKRNAGYDLWYNSTPSFSSSGVEYSHCFGKVTSGFDLGTFTGCPKDYNVRYLNNIEIYGGNDNSVKRNTQESLGETFVNRTSVPSVVENNITIEKDEFYGDIVEFNSYDYTETSIDTIYHRFNTAQREYVENKGRTTSDAVAHYANIKYDEILYDDYDVTSNGGIQEFCAITRSLNDQQKNIVGQSGELPEFIGNLSPEGYFYKPHFEIKLKEEAYVESAATAKVINYANCSLDYTTYGYKVITLKFPTNYGFVKGEHISFYNKETQDSVWGEIQYVSGNTMVLHVEDGSFRREGDGITYDNVKYLDPQSKDRIFTAYWTKEDVPCYAKYCKTRKAYVWRPIVPPSEMTRDMDLYDMTFSNGRLYTNVNIPFFLRRQDPDGAAGLSTPINPRIVNPANGFNVDGYERMDLSSIRTFVNNFINLCR